MNIGFANLPIEFADIGTRLVLATPMGEMQATVCKSPWFPAQKTIPEDLEIHRQVSTA